MSMPEVWLRGGVVPGIAPLLQPVAHGLLQCQEELHHVLGALSPAQLAARPGGGASIEFHVRHAAGSLDRLLTYARGEALAPPQLATLAAEGQAHGGEQVAAELRALFDTTIAHALAQLRGTDPESLLETRAVGRAALPSTVIGLLFHAAEHTQRHLGQVATLAALARAGYF